MGRVAREPSRRAIDAALDVGITHFDVARLYGYGEAEALLGEALKGRRDRVVIASKFGLNPPRRAGALRMLKPLAQKLAATVPGARAVLRSLVGGPALAADRFSVFAAQVSLDQSLAALQTDYLDILFLHDCTAVDLGDELVAFLDAQVAAGKIRAYGADGDIEAIVALQRVHGDRLIYQFANSLGAPNADRLAGAGCRIVTHSSFFGAGALRGQPNVHETMLAHALAVPDVAVVLCSMLSEAHLRANVAVAEKAAADHLSAIAVAAE